MNKNWKTTTSGILAIVTAAIAMVANPLLDDDPTTAPNWAAFVPIIIAGVGQLFARDWNVTSKQQGLDR